MQHTTALAFLLRWFQSRQMECYQRPSSAGQAAAQDFIPLGSFWAVHPSMPPSPVSWELLGQPCHAVLNQMAKPGFPHVRHEECCWEGEVVEVTVLVPFAELALPELKRCCLGPVLPSSC